ncbi:MAG: carbamate kinase, partial [Candidatus Thorarchaeota archaeon]
ACGGGGIPVIKENKRLYGVEAVIDKDLASAKLAEQINADILLIATDVEKVALNYGSSDQKNLDTLSIAKAKEYLAEGQFPPGSMGPKIQAIVNFLESGGDKAIITSIDKIIEALEGKAGTQIYN